MPASNPYNPYFGPGLLPIQIGPEHAASAMAGSPLPQAMSIASNAGTQPQKRTDRVQVKPLKPLVVVCVLFMQVFVYVLKALSKTVLNVSSSNLTTSMPHRTANIVDE